MIDQPWNHAGVWQACCMQHTSVHEVLPKHHRSIGQCEELHAMQLQRLWDDHRLSSHSLSFYSCRGNNVPHDCTSDPGHDWPKLDMQRPCRLSCRAC